MENGGYDMNTVYQKVVECYDSIKEQIPFTPKVALVLGSGLGNYADTMDVKAEIDYSEIEQFPVSTVRTCRKVHIWICQGCTCSLYEREGTLL